MVNIDQNYQNDQNGQNYSYKITFSGKPFGIFGIPGVPTGYGPQKMN